MSNWPPRFGRSRRPLRPLLGVLLIAVVAVLTSASPAASSSTATTYQVPSSIPADCSVDVTSQLLSWIGSVPDNSVLSFGANGCYRIEGTLELRNRAGLDLEGNGATFRSFNAPSDQRAIWRVIDSSGFVFHNMTIIGSYTKGGTLDSSLQHAHAIDLRGTSAEVSSVSMSNLAGDCVYFGLGYSSATRSSGSVHDSTCVGTSRNAVSLTAADNVLVTRVTTDKIGLTAFDVEPNVGTGFGSNGATFDSNKIGSYYLYAFAVVEDEPVSNQSFTNNVVSGRGLRIGIVSGGGSYRASNITISGNSDTNSQVPAAIEGDNVDTLTITGNTIPLTSGTMAAIDNTCNAAVSNNSYPGGTSQYTITNTPASCTTTTTSTSAPSVSSFSPSSGSPGTSVTISGANLTGATAVTFNGTTASFTVNSASQVTATVPSGATSGPVVVTTPAGTATSATSFSVTAPASTKPTVTSFSPSSGAPGTNVTLAGTNFAGVTAVKFNGVTALFTVVSATQITTVVPKGATTGPVGVTTASGTGTSKKSFRVTK
jgi:IPT/TIG domain